MRNGRFITLEGGEGVGKTTLAVGLARRLSQAGVEVVRTREPGGSERAEAIRVLALHPPSGRWSAETEILLMFAARRDHLEATIWPALARGATVLCDRFTDSTRAYQGGGMTQLLGLIDDLDRAFVGARGPDLTLILDAGESATRARRAQRAGEQDAFEARDADFHRRVRAAFQDIANRFPERCARIDADQSADRVLDAAWGVLVSRFPDLVGQVQQ
jgi:dTMP kinase